MSQCAVSGPCGQLCHECLIDSVNKEFDFRLLCTGSSSPLPLNMAACAKLVSTPPPTGAPLGSRAWSALYVPFPPPQATRGKWLAQGLTEGRQ